MADAPVAARGDRGRGQLRAAGGRDCQVHGAGRERQHAHTQAAGARSGTAALNEVGLYACAQLQDNQAACPTVLQLHACERTARHAFAAAATCTSVRCQLESCCSHILCGHGNEKNTHAEPKCAGILPVQAALERLLQQLVAVQDEWLEANGGLGEPFRLQRHLLPPAAPKKAAAGPHGGAHHNGAAPMDRD